MANIRQLYEGVKILMKYEQEAYSLQAEHDQLYCGETNPDVMTLEDLKTLEDNKWIWDEDIEGWFIFT